MQIYTEDIFQDNTPKQDSWKTKQLLDFSSIAPTIYNYMSYQSEHNEQPIYGIDCLNSEDIESDSTILQIPYRSYL